jgi:hypothetical protein
MYITYSCRGIYLIVVYLRSLFEQEFCSKLLKESCIHKRKLLPIFKSEASKHTE